MFTNKHNTLVIASDNVGKVRELRALFADMPVKLVPQSTFGISSAEENGDSFAANARIKAEYAARESGLPALSDDSGLAVDALDGRPGIYSARYAGMSHAHSSERDRANIDKLLDELKGVPEEKRTAHFCCALALVWPPTIKSAPEDGVYVGEWHGRILQAPRGANGFGYDPVFLVSEKNCSAAELEPEEKHRISHRAHAWAQLLPYLERCGLR